MFTYVIICDYKLQCQKYRYKKCLLISKITSFKTLNFLYGPLLDAMTNQYYTWVKCLKLLQKKMKMATESLNLGTNWKKYIKELLSYYSSKLRSTDTAVYTLDTLRSMIHIPKNAIRYISAHSFGTSQKQSLNNQLLQSQETFKNDIFILTRSLLLFIKDSIFSVLIFEMSPNYINSEMMVLFYTLSCYYCVINIYITLMLGYQIFRDFYYLLVDSYTTVFERRLDM
ncbi:Hypothetical_protein [Hexamita inflata]|uniref:Hypothetical_protein n=1 Tax=Hexamita inflata TaxID=28002 RepID=A0AA86PJD2_9EUKA|nr:Hypothetical protein HINF_LOCUS24367 [Hexamita inflata]